MFCAFIHPNIRAKNNILYIICAQQQKKRANFRHNLGSVPLAKIVYLMYNYTITCKTHLLHKGDTENEKGKYQKSRFSLLGRS